MLELGSGEKAPIALRACRSTSAFFGCISIAMRQTSTAPFFFILRATSSPESARLLSAQHPNCCTPASYLYFNDKIGKDNVFISTRKCTMLHNLNYLWCSMAFIIAESPPRSAMLREISSVPHILRTAQQAWRCSLADSLNRIIILTIKSTPPSSTNLQNR